MEPISGLCALPLLILAPLGLLGSVGLVLLVLKIATIIEKAAEPPTTDEGGHYSLEQSKDVGQQEG
jgi:hypothetical protein